uniref:Uncharacterized protein n=1 Tax=Peronospora matthiolae TaxID=2874970 RepID=A0AAV1UA19_9STRA
MLVTDVDDCVVSVDINVDVNVLLEEGVDLREVAG